MLHITVAGAFFGGTFALLSPCSALLLPAFFAYAFKSKRKLAARTGVFLLGLVTLLVPLGMGASFAGRLILDYRDRSIWIIGGLLIVFGIIELSGRGFSLWPARFGRPALDGGFRSAYATGVVYAFAGFCSGPLLGAVLTMAAGAGHPLYGALLLFAYAAGMASPLFVLALLWDRYDLGNSAWLRGKPVRIGRAHIHSTRLISGSLFILLGGLFIASGGTVAFERFYARTGLLHWSMNVQQKVMTWGGGLPDWVSVVVTVTVLFGLLFVWRKRRSS